MAELLKVKGLVEEEREKLLHSGAKEGRPIVTTSGAAAGNGGSPPDDHEPRSSSVASSSSKVNGGHGGGSGSVDLKEPPVTSPGGTNLVRPPFMAGHPNFPMWPFFPNAGMMGGANGNNNRDRDSRDSSRDNNNGNASSSSSSLDRLDSGSSNIKEGSPGPKEGGGSSSAKRKKTASGSGGSNSSKEGRGDRHDHAAGGMPQLNDSIPGHPGLTLGRGGPLNDNDKLHDDDMEKEGNGMMHLPPGLDRHQLANYVPNQKLEWKRYKQYTRSDIMAAIEEVKKGKQLLTLGMRPID